MTGTEELALLQAAFAAGEAIWKVVEGARSGAVDPATATALISSTHATLVADDAAADAALAAKFPAKP